MKKLPLILLVFCSLNAFAQSLTPQVVASGGTYFEGNGVSLSSTIGETVTATLSGNNEILTQGFQQPKIEIVNSITEQLPAGIQLSVYPNPTAHMVYLDIQSEQGTNEQIQLQVSDLSGKVLLRQELQYNSNNSINLSALSSGQYLLNIISSEGQIFSAHKIQKIQ